MAKHFPTEMPQKTTIDLLELLEVIKVGRISITFSAILGLFLGALLFIIFPPQYKGELIIKLQTDKTKAAFLSLDTKGGQIELENPDPVLPSRYIKGPTSGIPNAISQYTLFFDFVRELEDLEEIKKVVREENLNLLPKIFTIIFPKRARDNYRITFTAKNKEDGKEVLEKSLPLIFEAVRVYNIEQLILLKEDIKNEKDVKIQEWRINNTISKLKELKGRFAPVTLNIENIIYNKPRNIFIQSILMAALFLFFGIIRSWVIYQKMQINNISK